MKEFESKIRILMMFYRNFSNLIIKGFELGLDNPNDLNPKHFQTLMVLLHHGSCTMHELSSRVMLKKGSFTPVANKLLSLDYIRKERSTEDKRIYYIHLTDKGIEFANEFHEKHHVYIEDKFTNLSNEERERYFVLLEELRLLNEKMI